MTENEQQQNQQREVPVKRIQILLEDNPNGTTNINVSALDGATFADPSKGEHPSNAEALAAQFLNMVNSFEQQLAKQRAAAQRIVTPPKPAL